MEDHKRWALDINRKNIVNDLQIEEIKDLMIQRFVLDADDFEVIHTSGRSRKERNGKFLDDLVTRGPHAFDIFCDALEDKRAYLSEQLRRDSAILAKKVARGVKIEIDALTLQSILSENDSLKQASQDLKQAQYESEELQRKIDTLQLQLNRDRKWSEEMAEENKDMKRRASKSEESMHILLDVVNEKRRQREDVERDVEGLEKIMSEMDMHLNVKEEKIRRVVKDKSEVELRLKGEQRMVSNLRAQVATLVEDIKMMEKDMARMKRDRDIERKVAHERGRAIQKLQYELTLSNQMKKNCESVIGYLNGTVQSKDKEARQAQKDLSKLLEQYMEHKQTVN